MASLKKRFDVLYSKPWDEDMEKRGVVYHKPLWETGLLQAIAQAKKECSAWEHLISVTEYDTRLD